ncbi:MAG: T9SS type A sorting domain-containing protein [Chitinophagales bacterium]|nr:T9SS type A sorting domain-containing protein [Chitinophagales bacterium]
MKKFLLPVCLLATVCFVQAQNLVISPSPSEGVEEGGEIWVAHATLANNGTEAINLNWVRTENDYSDGWYTAICDFALCYSPGTDVAPSFMPMDPGESGDIKVNFYTNGLAGEGYVELEYYDIEDSAGYNTLGVFTASRLTSAFFTPGADNTFEVYPNPAVNEVNVVASFSSNVHAINLINIVGKTVQTAKWNTSTGKMVINIQSLPEGIYFVQFVNDKNEIIATKKISVKS